MDYRQQTIFWGIYFTHRDPIMLWPPNGLPRGVARMGEFGVLSLEWFTC